MTENQKLDSAWIGWNEVMRKVASLMRGRDFAAALSEVEAFLARERNPELRSDALGMRADLREELGDLKGAEEDLRTARSLVGPTYGRYVHELSLGCVSEKRESVNEAVSWYQTALRTCIEGEGISGGTALQKLLRLRAQEVLTAEDRTLCARAAQKSWQVLGLPGEPDLADISRAVSTIKEGEANPPRRRRSPDPLED